MSSKPIVLLDTDFHALADDHEALVMLGARHRLRELQLAALTVVTGNTWANVSAAHADDALRELGLSSIPVFEGAGQPLLHRQADFAHRSRLYGAAFGGAWGNADLLTGGPGSGDGAPAKTGQHAVSFLVEFLRAAERPVTLASIGPLTNIAMALRMAPDIVDSIERLVCMGGAFYVPGNVTPSAEFNWWFDPEAAAIVLEANLAVEIVPLDATDDVVLDATRYGDWSRRFGEHPFFRSFHAKKFGEAFARDPEFSLPAWDAVAAGYLLDPSLATASESLWVTVDCSHGPSYGRVVAFRDAEAFNLSVPERDKATVVLTVDEERFWHLYESLVFTGNANAAAPR